MGVAAHLGIRLSEYDARIRTFIPDYEEMLDAAASAIAPDVRTIVDLGVGTGALAARCRRRAPRARLVGIDSDAEILAIARRRLGPAAALVAKSFLSAKIPTCDAVVASFAFHHIRTRAAKARLYRRIRASLRAGGRSVSVDCHPASDRQIARRQRGQWEAHLRRFYTRREADRLLSNWADEDTYVPLDVEVGLMRRAALRVEVVWRKGAFAVLVGAP
jgi:trans-aconitate methyltransferase